MKFGKEFASQKVPEWEEAYMDYNYLKKMLKEIMNLQNKRTPGAAAAGVARKGTLRRRLTLYRAYSGLTSRGGLPGTPRGNEEEEATILVSPMEDEEGTPERYYYQTTFLMSSEEGGDSEALFFKRLDEQLNKVIKFYVDKVEEVNSEAGELNKQMDALIALRIRIHNPLEGLLDKEDREGKLEEGEGEGNMDEAKAGEAGFRQAPLEVLDHVKINVEPENPISTVRTVLMCSNDLSFSQEELKGAEEKMRKALIEFYQKLRLLKNYNFLNQLAFSKIMKKYDKITSRNAWKPYLKMVDNSYLGSSDEVSKLIEKVEATFIKHFSNGNRRKGMRRLRPQAKKRERHRVTFLLGLFTGCSIALVVALIVIIHARDILESEGREQYMENIFPLYSLFGYIVLHAVVYAGAIYFWRRYRVNYPFIFGFEQRTELNYREVLLVASGLSVLAMAAALSNLDMEMDERTESFRTVTELVPLGLLLVVLSVTFCPFNIVYRSSRFFLIKCGWHCLCAPLYKVQLPDFFLADQLTSQVQSLRSLLYYVCYYGWGDFKKRSNKCGESQVYQVLYIIVAIIPFWSRFLQCLRRLFEEKDTMQGVNGLKYFSTVIALVMRTLYDQRRGMTWKVWAAVTSALTTVFNTYWDIVIDWGLLRRNARYPWLRDKLLVPNKAVYFVAIILDILLRLVWMQLVLDFNEAPFLHRKALVAVVASLEILRRGIWNFFRLENEHLNNVGKYRAFKSVPLPFNYEDKSL